MVVPADANVVHWAGTPRRWHSALGDLSPNDFERADAVAATRPAGNGGHHERTGLNGSQIGEAEGKTYPPGGPYPPVLGKTLRLPTIVYLRVGGDSLKLSTESGQLQWKGRVKKENIEALKSIVDDIGADRGILFCENDFQPSARDAARNTNVLLQTSLEEFKRTVCLDKTRATLVYKESDEPDASPVQLFLNGDQPHHLLLYGGRVFVGNWGTGNISIVDPATKTIESTIALDKYEASPSAGNGRVIRSYLPGDMACADEKIFVGQVFSDFVLAIDIDTQSIVKRIMIPGGGEGAIAASQDGRWIYFASNQVNGFFIINSATYEYRKVDYPTGGKGSLCVLPHPFKPLLYVGIQRGGNLNGRTYRGGNCFLATYDLAEDRYVESLYLAEVENGRSDDSMPICLIYDEEEECLFVGMFQSRQGICRVDERGREILANIRFLPNARNKHFRWVDPLSQALHRNKLLSVNRNNFELVTLDKFSGCVERAVFLGEAPNGPEAVVVVDDVAIVSYPERRGLIFHSLCGGQNA